MGLKFNNCKLTDLAAESTCRFDVKFIQNLNRISNGHYNYKHLFEIVDYSKIKPESLPESFEYVEIGNVDKNGVVEPHRLSFDDRNELNEALFKKIEKGDIIKPAVGNILISCIRPYLNKTILIEDEGRYFTKAFIQIKPLIDPKILFYCLRGIYLSDINSVSRQGKGYPTLKDFDLKTVRFSKSKIDTLLSNHKVLVKNIVSIENEIKELSRKRQSDKAIINRVFSNHFNIALKELQSIDNKKSINLSIGDVGFRNHNFRQSYRWFKLEVIQKYLYNNIGCIRRLGDFIISTNNGWSPQSEDDLDGTPVMGQEHICHNGSLKIAPTKSTLKTKKGIENFYIRTGNFFVSRGNTIDLVALASVIDEAVNDDIIYPDLYIKVDFNEFVDKKYIALLFNSFFGRFYFKYASKGKNQTMVKISADELYNFYLPLPDIGTQTEIVEMISQEIEKCSEIDQEIFNKRRMIFELIDNYIELDTP
ncbi:restriction endonuclease subunit S [Photobacterium leiognathi]|uniref:restriction endonuclease subunit S n=1 Tax=Photobacterium leiognathi TaxID=553611 RepID=UPI00298234EC|nr:restriction endonuclease subunit S [Photobacterium leiognathi]